MHISAARHVHLSSVIFHNRSARQLPGKKADLRACRSTFELLIFIDLECDNATDAGSNTDSPLALVLTCFLCFLARITDQRWLVEVGGRGENRPKWQLIFISGNHISSALLVSAMCVCVPSQRRLTARKKKSKECK